MKQLLSFFLILLPILSYGKVYGVFVGLSLYEDKDYNLPAYMNGDIKRLYSYYDTGSLEPSDLILLTNTNATKRNIISSLERQFAQATADDTVVFCYSGHGGYGFFTTYHSCEYLYHYELKQIYAKCKAKLKLCFANACHSGSIQIPTYLSPAEKNALSDQEVIVFISSRDDELSWGLYFTDPLVEGLKGAADANNDNLITVKELFNYVHTQVVEYSNGIQHPVMFGKFNPNKAIVDLRSINY